MQTILKRINENKILIGEDEVKLIHDQMHPYYDLIGAYGEWSPTPIDCEWDYLILVFKDTRDKEEYAVTIVKNDRLQSIGPLSFVEEDDYDDLDQDPESPVTQDPKSQDGGLFKSVKGREVVCVKKDYFEKMNKRMDLFYGRLNDE